MPGKLHNGWEIRLYNHLRNRIMENNRRQTIIWYCPHHNFHFYDLLEFGFWAERERRFESPSGILCCPDIQILDYYGKPNALVEIVRSNPMNNNDPVGEEMGIPVFKIMARHANAIQKACVDSRHWWGCGGFSPAELEEMRFLHEVGEEMVSLFNGDNGDTNDIWHSIDVMEDGRKTLRHSDPSMDGENGFPLLGGLIWADECSWDCTKALQYELRHREIDLQDYERDEKLRIEKDVGREVMEAFIAAMNCPARFIEPFGKIVPLGQCQLSITAQLQPLSQEPDGTLLRLVDKLQQAKENVVNRHEHHGQ